MTKISSFISENKSVILVLDNQRVEVKVDSSDYAEVFDAIRGEDQDYLLKYVDEKLNSMKFTETRNSLSIEVDNQIIMIGRFDLRFKRVSEALGAKNWNLVREAIKPENALTDTGFDLKDGEIWHDGEKLPDSLVKRVRDLISMGMKLDPVLKFWKKLKDNPSYNCRENLYKFLEANNIPLTEDGDFIGYKKVREDFKDIHSGTFDNSPGQVLSMPRNKVSDLSSETCSSGLHVCSFEYLSHFGNSTTDKVLLVEVNPTHCVSIPIDYNWTKLRVCQYRVLSVLENVQPLNQAIFNNDSTNHDFDSSELEDEDFEETNGYSKESRDEVISLFNEYSNRYEGDSLVARIGEDCEELDEETIEQILVDEGQTTF